MFDLKEWQQFTNRVEHAGKYYAMDNFGDVLVWRCASRRTMRHHWVLVRNPPVEVRNQLAIGRE